MRAQQSDFLPTSSVAAWAPNLQALPDFPSVRSWPAFTLEWAGGFIDGEGCIHVSRTPSKNGQSQVFGLRLTITQNDLGVLQHLERGLGIPVRIYEVRLTAQHSRQVYTLNYCGEAAMRAIALLLPHLVRKRAEAEAAWTYWVMGKAGARFPGKKVPKDVLAVREWFYFRLRALKHESPSYSELEPAAACRPETQ